MTAVFVSPNGRPMYDKSFMMAQGDTRLVALKDGTGYKCRSSHPLQLGVRELTSTSKNIRPEMRRIAMETAGKGQRLFLLKGKGNGFSNQYVYLEAHKGRNQAKVMVEIVDIIKVPVAFHVVRHIPSKSKSHSAHSRKWTSKTDLEKALGIATDIYRAAGIVLTMHSHQNSDYNVDFGPVIVVDKKMSPDLLNLQKLSKPSCINVFVIGELRNNEPGSNGCAYGRDIVVDTRDSAIDSFGRLIAHELGHAFGYPQGHPSAVFKRTKEEIAANAPFRPTRYLMSISGGGLNIGISRNAASDMRTHAKNISKK